MAARKNLTQFAILVAAVAVVVTVSVVFQHWWNNRPAPNPASLAIEASSGDNTVEVTPFTACELGEKCPENPVPSLKIGKTGDVKLVLPKDVYDHDWALTKVYDEPAASGEEYFKAYEAKEATIPVEVDAVDGSDGHRPRLVVVEVKSLLVGQNDEGQEAPFEVVWSLSTDDAFAHASATPAPEK
ncbi:DUF2771 domain-containing protein [Corynebacterium aquilae]|uniref:DUF2771 domain-containing protein n=1 Tax=Corynebacterium aquilae DSM 44791 TaxID=1431546 RepID=A0A1L7CEP5_9CORY|nr:DUF2771 domain-containing protein [Corynebacterium aquilae]APT84294.1 hypothetical protein CAQU_03540 [Corynebacterium aquilae DSM 44791]